MTRISDLTPRIFQTTVFVVGLALGVTRVDGHAILKSSSPANGGFVTGSEVQVTLTFNVRIDAARSKLELLMPDASTVELHLLKRSSEDMLASKATGLKPGSYTIRWQVLAPDGHISRGEVPFTVRKP
jgi:methionine-rich copper-binding protein CopC